MEPITQMDFATVINAKKMKGSGLSRGDVVLVAGIKPAPIKASDPYLQRIYALVMKIVDGKVQVPNEHNDYKSILVDPRNLQKVTKDDYDKLTTELGKQFKHD